MKTETDPVWSALERKFNDGGFYEAPDSEQLDPALEPTAQHKRGNVNPLPPLEQKVDSMGHPQRLCRYCGEYVTTGIDEKYNKTVWLDWVPANGGQFTLSGGIAKWFGSRGAPYRKHACRQQTLQDQAL